MFLLLGVDVLAGRALGLSFLLVAELAGGFVRNKLQLILVRHPQRLLLVQGRVSSGLRSLEVALLEGGLNFKLAKLFRTARVVGGFRSLCPILSFWASES